MTREEVLAWYEDLLCKWRERMHAQQRDSKEWWRARCCMVEFSGCVRRLMAGEAEGEHWPRHNYEDRPWLHPEGSL